MVEEDFVDGWSMPLRCIETFCRFKEMSRVSERRKLDGVYSQDSGKINCDSGISVKKPRKAGMTVTHLILRRMEQHRLSGCMVTIC